MQKNECPADSTPVKPSDVPDVDVVDVDIKRKLKRSRTNDSDDEGQVD